MFGKNKTEKETKSKPATMIYSIMISELDEHLHPTDNYVGGILGIVDTEEEVIKGIDKYLRNPKYVRRYMISHGHKPFENYEFTFCLYEGTDHPRNSYITLFDVKEPGERAHYFDGCGHCWVLQRKVYSEMVDYNVEPVWQKVSFEGEKEPKTTMSIITGLGNSLELEGTAKQLEDFEAERKEIEDALLSALPLDNIRHLALKHGLTVKK